MTDTPAPSRISAKDLITLACAIIGAAFVISGAIRNDGQREQRLQVVESKTERLERRDETRSDTLAKIDIRTARIETKLEMMTRGAVQ